MTQPDPERESTPYLTVGPIRPLTLGAVRWWWGMSLLMERNRLPWVRLALFSEFLRRGVFVRGPVQGNPLELMREGRMTIGRGSIFESNVTLQSTTGRIRLGQRVLMNRGVTLGAVELIEIGDCSLIGPGCYITDGDHRVDDPVTPVPDQGMVTKGPTIIEDNVWLGANVVVASGVRIGRRSVIGANAVVTRDIPPYSVAVGAPAKVVATHKPADVARDGASA